MKVSDESTIVMTDGAPVQATVETQAEKPAETPAEQPKTKSGLWKGVVIGGVPGILLGSAGSLFASNAAEEEQVTEETETPEVGVAQNVNDEMSFADAYAAAREELGAGGVFVWNGNVYNTYNQEEWEALSDEEKADFLESVYGAPVMDQVAEPDTTEDVHVDVVTDDTPAEPVEAEPIEAEPVETGTVEAEPVEPETEVTEANAPVVDETPDGDTVGVVEVEQPADEAGNVTVVGQDVIETPEGVVNVTCVEVDGHYGEIYDVNNDGVADAALVDVDDDGTPDIQFVDENGDGLFCECEAYDISEADRIAMESGNTGDELYAGMPDYTNDADASSFA